MRKRLIGLYGEEALIEAGVLQRTSIKRQLDRCPGCDDCDSLPTIHSDPNVRNGYCAYCSRTGEKMPLEIRDVCVLEYSEEGLARRLAAAFGGAHAPMAKGEVWYLGKSARPYGRARR